MKQNVILSCLLDKYEKSKHLLQPGVSNRRVMLRVDKKELPEYDYQDAAVRDAYNRAARELELAGLVSIEWFKGRPVLAGIVLNLDHVMECYKAVGRIHPKELAQRIEAMASEQLAHVSTEWIAAWRDDVCRDARTSYKVPACCRKEITLFSELLIALEGYDSLHGEAVTMRAFSSKCFRDSKRFEREVRDSFLRIACQYNTGLAETCEQGALGIRDQLAYLGIYARPELYELSGDCVIRTAAGIVNVGALQPYGLALPSTSVDMILSFDFSRIRKVVFIENKTNYDEYILSERKSWELAVYHGGFLSPQKRKLFAKIAGNLSPSTPVFFWADIDLGGFQMFSHLQQIIPALLPMRMSGEEVEAYHRDGLVRSADYLNRVQAAFESGGNPLF